MTTQAQHRLNLPVPPEWLDAGMPPHPDPRLQDATLICSHAAVLGVFRDPVRYHHGFPKPGLLQQAMWSTDGRAHTDLRALMQAAFTPAAVQRRRSDIKAIVGRQFDDVMSGATAGTIVFDAWSVFSQISYHVICLIMGIEPENADFRALLDTASGAQTVMDIEDEQLVPSLERLVAEHRSTPRTGLLRNLISARDRGYLVDSLPMSEEQLFASIIMVLLAGYETNAAALTNAVPILDAHGWIGQLAATSPDLIAATAQELLRWLSSFPIHMEFDSESGGLVALSLVGANRDAAVFVDPVHFDPRRANLNRHLAFGRGKHDCLGKLLALATIEEVLLKLLGFSHVSWAGPEPPQWLTGVTIRINEVLVQVTA